MTGSRLRKIGWAVVLVTCTSLYGALHLRVNAVKSEVRLAERKIVALQEDKLLLETEFQTRANQKQLDSWNEVDFGYKAPDAAQFLEGERQLAQFGTPPAVGAPAPIRVARASVKDESSPFPSLVSPLASSAMAAELPRLGKGGLPPAPVTRENLSARLARGAVQIALDDIVEGAE